MSFYELFICLSVVSLLLNGLWKWKKALLFIVFMESVTAFTLALILVQVGSYYYFIIFMFVFFVSEALILISSLYKAIRGTGLVNSMVIV